MSYIRGMIANLDIQLNTAINWWIAAILLFDFKLVHVPTNKHHGPDGLLWCGPVADEEKDDNPKDWVDHMLSLGIWVMSWLEAVKENPINVAVLAVLSGHGETIKAHHPQHARQLPTQYHTGEFIPSNNLHPHTPQTTDTCRNDQDTEQESTLELLTCTSPTPAESDRSNEDKSPEPTKFSSSNKVGIADKGVEQIRQYLISCHAPHDLSEDALTYFISRAHHFLVTSRRLWRRQSSGRHQLYIPPKCHYSIVWDTHNNLGHKGFYAMHHTLLDHF